MQGLAEECFRYIYTKTLSSASLLAYNSIMKKRGNYSEPDSKTLRLALNSNKLCLKHVKKKFCRMIMLTGL